MAKQQNTVDPERLAKAKADVGFTSKTVGLLQAELAKHAPQTQRLLERILDPEYALTHDDRVLCNIALSASSLQIAVCAQIADAAQKSLQGAAKASDTERQDAQEGPCEAAGGTNADGAVQSGTEDEKGA